MQFPYGKAVGESSAFGVYRMIDRRRKAAGDGLDGPQCCPTSQSMVQIERQPL